MFCGNRGAAMVVQSPSYPHQKHGAISVLFTPKAGVNKHFHNNNHYYNKGSCQKKNRFFLGDLSQIWVGGVADSQTRSKPFKTPPNCPENRLFRPKFHLSFSQISQKPWGGWVGKQIWERSPKKKNSFFWQLPLVECWGDFRQLIIDASMLLT